MRTPSAAPNTTQWLLPAGTATRITTTAAPPVTVTGTGTETETETITLTESHPVTETATVTVTDTTTITDTTTVTETATVTSTATVTTTPPVFECATDPARCGYPGADSTGVPDGITLQRIPEDVIAGPGWNYDARGWISIWGDGTVFEGYQVRHNIDVNNADNVVIRNVRLHLGGDTFGISLRHAAGTRMENLEISAPDAGPNRLLAGIKDIYGDATNTVVLDSDISGTSTAIQLNSGVIQGNYLHDLGANGSDNAHGVSSGGGSLPLVIRDNTVLNQFDHTSAIGLFQDFSVHSSRIIERNLLSGGTYTLYAGAGGLGPTSNIVVVNNRFSRGAQPNGGRYGPATAFEAGEPGNLWSGNIWDDDEAAVLP